MGYNNPVRYKDVETTRGIPRPAPGGDTRPKEKTRIPDFLRLVEDLRMLKNRALSHDMSRLEQEHQSALANALKSADRRAKPGDVEDLHRHQAEARRYVDAENERSKEILSVKYENLDSGLLALSQYLKAQSPLKELEAALAAKEDELLKLEQELTIKKKVLSHETEELDREKNLLNAAEDALGGKTNEVEAMLDNLDVVKRAEELDTRKMELDQKHQAMDYDLEKLGREREAINSERTELDEQRAIVDAEEARVVAEREQLETEKSRMAEKFAREIGATFEAFVRDMIRSNQSGEQEQG